MSDDGLSLSESVVVNKQISQVILTPGNDALLVAYQINISYNTHARDSKLFFVKSIPINDSLKETINLTVLNGLIFERVYGS